MGLFGGKIDAVAMDFLQRNSQKALATLPSTTPTRIFWDKTESFSDFHQGFCSACAAAGVISMCFENAEQIDAENSKREEENGKLVTILRSFLGILHNISRRLRDRELFANREQTLLHFARKKDPKIAALSLLALAYLVDENTNYLILADENLPGGGPRLQ